MPKITINKNTLMKLVGKKFTDKELEEKIPMLGVDMESIEGNDLIVEVFPNRPDLLSDQGFARAFKAFIGKKTGLISFKIKDSKEKVIVDPKLSNIRPYTACAIVKNVKFNDENITEIMQLQEKLHITFCRNRKKASIGIYPLDKIKFPIYYKALEPGKIKFKPLEEKKELTAIEILNKTSKGKFYKHLLEDFKLYPCFIDSNNNFMSLIPVINSELTGKVTEKTKNVFIEVSGIDLNTINQCLNIIVTTLVDMGGEIYSLQIQYKNQKLKTPNLSPTELKIDLNYINKILGLKINENDTEKYLAKMGLGYKNKKALIPSYRTDIMHQIDIAEEIAIAYGYNNFEHSIPNISTIAEEDKIEKFKSLIKQILIGLNFTEINTFHLSNKKNQCNKMNHDFDLIELENALTEDYNALRAWLIPSLIETLHRNKHNEYPQNIFTIGYSFSKDNKFETNIKEELKLAVCLASADVDYTKIRQVLDSLFLSLNLTPTYKESNCPSFIAGRIAEVLIKGKSIATLGEISPLVLTQWNLETPVAAFELNLSVLFDIVN
ncbi:phenylalanine--tRNA ligase subunit beta [Candidatus Woesearchaeota archaeon]|nr:phenylalanine--tRNA ligase subunit beta [Candidatus Woesearchaeota archaeon]